MNFAKVFDRVSNGDDTFFLIVIVIVIAVGEVRGEEGELDEDDDQTEADLGHQ